MTLRITDSGIGIPPESLPYIFDRYYKGASIAFRRSESSGIGLAYTKELLELHKATIQCESELGKGSVFTVALPISEEAYPEEWLEYSNLNGRGIFAGISSIGRNKLGPGESTTNAFVCRG